MGAFRFVVAALLATGCLPKPQPAQPQQPYPPPQYAQPQQAPQPYAQPQQGPATAQGGVTVATTDAGATPSPTSTTPAPSATTQPPPLPPGPAQQPPPFPAAQPAQAPYPQQYQPYPPPQAYPPPPAYPPPAPYTSPTEGRRRFHDGEVIADFAVVGTFASLDILARQDVEDGNAVGFILVAGMAGGGGVGYLLTQKYDVDAGAAHSTTLGLTLGFANAALLIEPTGWDRTESILNLMFLGSAVGATGGFIYGQAAKLTSGQSLFVANLAMLGTATAALGAIGGSRDGEFGTWENTTLALGLDGGTVAGALIAPSLDWSPRRSKVVLASTVIGAFAGGMMAGLLANNDGESRTDNGDVVAGAMTAGLWGGFGLGVMMTKQYSPDPRFAQPSAARTAVRQPASAPATVMPWVGQRGQLGVMTGGSF